MKVEIWSDVVCPFCYIGKKHFEKALEALPFKESVEVEWKSFQLDPSIPEEGLQMTSAEYLEKRKGYPKQQLDQMFQHLAQQGKTVGIDFKNEQAIPANTFKAHRLIHFVQNAGKGSEIEEALFKAHFTDGKDVNNTNVLVELAGEIGLDTQAANKVLTSEQHTDDVKKDIAEARQFNIQGVPFFVIDRKYGLSGAQPIDAFKQALTQAYEESKPKFEMKGNAESDACGPEGCEV